MKKTVTFIAIAIIAIVVIVLIANAIHSGSTISSLIPTPDTAQSNTPTTNPTTPTESTSTPAHTASGYTAAEVASHNSASSCWSIINGNVYDLTAWISQHPGGEGPILSICGKNGSAAFNNQHGRQGRPNSILATYKIGAVAQ